MISGINGGFNAQDLAAMRQARFNRLDQNGDSKLSKEELQAAAPGNGKGANIDKIFAKVDTNQDGSIDQAEDQAAFAKVQQHRAHGPQRPPPDATKMADQLFKKTDGDEDGKITQGELTTALEKVKNGPSAADVFKVVDTDNDGAITKTELVDALKKALEEMRPKATADQAGQTTQSGQAEPASSTGYGADGVPKPPPPPDGQFSALA